MKMPLYWHKECQKNAQTHYARMRKKAEEDMADALDGEARTAFYLRQIEEAERRGLDAFDRDRFMKPKISRRNP